MDSILFWNHCALEANRISHTHGLDKGALGPTGSSRAIAIIHLAMHDAYVGAKGRTNTTLSIYDFNSPTPAPGTAVSVNGAIAGAAHETLRLLYPDTSAHGDFNLANHLTVAFNMFNEADWDNGVTYGRMVAMHILGLRTADPDLGDSNYDTVAPRGRGKHQKDPDNPTQGYHAPYYGAGARLFAATKRHAINVPPQPGTTDYERYLVEVKEKGIKPELMGNVPYAKRRDVDKTVIGVYWGYDGAKYLGTPPRLYNQIVREIAIHRGNTLEQNVRLFALVNAAMGDAGILAWEQKYVHNFWRPVVGIRNHDVSLGSDAVPGNNLNNAADTEWLPYGGPKSNEPGKKNFTPPFPAYPSGHATFGAASLHVVRKFYNVNGAGPDNLFNGLHFISDEYNGITADNNGTVRPLHRRNFPNGLWDMIIENGLSRVYIGVHWAFDAFQLDENGNPDLNNIIDANGNIKPAQNVGGVPLGLAIAEDVFRNFKKSNVGPAPSVA